MRRDLAAFALFFGVLGLASCEDRELRGKASPSPDGRTYLSVDDDNGGKCGPILVDGKKWPYPPRVIGEVDPGKHVIACGGEIGFVIKPGTTFHFDYWGP
jgi:hypothetical protein